MADTTAALVARKQYLIDKILSMTSLSHEDLIWEQGRHDGPTLKVSHGGQSIAYDINAWDLSGARPRSDLDAYVTDGFSFLHTNLFYINIQTTSENF
jgi:hypothetical protein